MLGNFARAPHRATPALVGLVASLALATGTLWAAQRPISLDELVRRSPHIFVGEVTAVQGSLDEWPGVGQVIFSDVTVEILEQWRGIYRRESVVLRVPGGTTPDGTRMVVTGAPVFRVGEKVLVFATTHLGRPWVFGWNQGKYRMVGNRVEGRPGAPIPDDILAGPLRKKVAAILRKSRTDPGGGR